MPGLRGMSSVVYTGRGTAASLPIILPRASLKVSSSEVAESILYPISLGFHLSRYPPPPTPTQPRLLQAELQGSVTLRTLSLGEVPLVLLWFA